MYRLRRMYLDSIGVPENRFSDLLVDFTDAAGMSTDTIVWLRNGAGKTTMLSLLLALILPHRGDFLATRTKKRTLEDLVLATDTAHVVAEWEDPRGQVLVTGAVYEWDGRSRPHDYNGRGKEKLQRSWWCLRPDLDVEGAVLEQLPFTLRSRGAYDRERFCAHITGLAAQGVNATVAHRTIEEWHSALRERRFDPELFHYFTEVNAAEGGIDGLFAGIDSPGKFVRYLLKFVGDQQRVKPVRDLLSDTTVEIAKRPVYLAERTFCAEARPYVSELGAAHQLLIGAGTALNAAEQHAAGVKYAVQEAITSNQRRRERESTRAGELDGLVSTTRSAIEIARAQRAEYLRIAAVFDLRAAESAATAAETESEAAALDAKAWEAVGHLIELGVRRAELGTHEDALRAAAQEAKPLMAQLDSAKARLAGALDREIAKANLEIEELNERVEAAGSEAKTADERWRSAEQAVTRLNAETDSIHDALDRFERSRNQLIESGIAEPDEPLTATETRMTAELQFTTATAQELAGQKKAVETDITSAEVAHEDARQAVTQAVGDRRSLCEQLDTLAARGNALSDNIRLRNLLQTHTVDLEQDAADAVTALAHAESAADVELLRLNQSSATARRSIHAVDTTRLLPPRVAVEQVIEDLAAKNITAHSGWQYLAEHIDVTEHDRVIAELPLAVDGVVVYSDPTTAVAGIRSDDLVVVSSADIFHTRHSAHTVLGPAPAQHDRSAAATELTRLQARQEADHARHTVTTDQRNADARLRTAIEVWSADLPPDGLTGLRRRVAAATEAVERGEERENAAGTALADLRAESSTLGDRIAAATGRMRELDVTLPRVRELAATERDEVAPHRVRLRAIPRELEREQSRAATQKTRGNVARESAVQLGTERTRLESTRADWAARRKGLPEMSIPVSDSLEVVEAAARIADQHLREQFSEDSLRLAITTAEGEVKRVARIWNRHSDKIRDRATELADEPGAADGDLRQFAAERAATRLERAGQASGKASTELDSAQRALARAVTARNRERSAIDVEEPQSGAQAEDLAAAAESEMNLRETERFRYEEARTAARTAVTDAEVRIGLLVDQTALVRGVEPRESTGIALPEEDSGIRALVSRTVDELERRRTDRVSAERMRAECAEALGLWAGNDEFGKVAEDEHGRAVRYLREMFRDKAWLPRVAETAEDLVRELETRSNAITLQLEQVEAHKNNVAIRLTDLVADALTMLTRASTLSELPDGIGPWAHQRFLVVEPKARPSREQIGLRIGELIDTMVNAGSVVIDPPELLWRATEASVPEGFRASVLKPAPDQPTGRTAVEEMRKWSGGENLTASLVLFCVLARLRAEQRTGSRNDSAGGVLPLDNPLGKANYLPFLDLQRRVARANGVQLVFWTGIGDLGAVTTFPRIAAMHKRPSTTRPGRAYVQADPEHTHVLDIASTVRDES